DDHLDGLFRIFRPRGRRGESAGERGGNEKMLHGMTLVCWTGCGCGPIARIRADHGAATSCAASMLNGRSCTYQIQPGKPRQSCATGSSPRIREAAGRRRPLPAAADPARATIDRAGGDASRQTPIREDRIGSRPLRSTDALAGQVVEGGHRFLTLDIAQPAGIDRTGERLAVEPFGHARTGGAADLARRPALLALGNARLAIERAFGTDAGAKDKEKKKSEAVQHRLVEKIDE